MGRRVFAEAEELRQGAAACAEAASRDGPGLLRHTKVSGHCRDRKRSTCFGGGFGFFGKEAAREPDVHGLDEEAARRARSRRRRWKEG